MNYADQIEVIKDLSVDEGQSIRMDCPFCMRSNTFSISKENSKVLWYCFSASCDAKGVFHPERTMEDVYHFIYSKREDTDGDFIIPKFITSFGKSILENEILQLYLLFKLNIFL